MGRGTDRQTVRLEDGQSDELGIDRMRDRQGGVMNGGMERVTDCGIDRGWMKGWTGDGLWIDGETDRQMDRVEGWGMDRGMGRAVDNTCSKFYLSEMCHK